MAWNEPKDLLERATNARFLTDYLAGQYAANGESHFVLALDSAWGRGKTYFLTNWKEDLQDEGYPVVYFDAWANDFSEDPLVALISELFAGLAPIYKNVPGASKIALNVKKGALKASKLTIKVLLNLLLKKLAGESLDGIQAYMDDEIESETDSNRGAENSPSPEKAAIDKKALNKAIDDLTTAAFKEHASKKRAITEFRMSLASLLDVIKKHKKDMKLPLFIFIDELDRCRPNFAVEVLEVVKHLFDVPGVYFVIATHIDQLAASINVLYGEKFDSRQYLKRFFQQEYVLPSPEPMKFIQYLYQQYRPLATLPEHRLFVLFENASFLNPPAPPREIAQEVEVFLCLAKAFNLSLRDMEQAMVMLKAICLTWKKERQMHLCYLLFWIMLRQKNAEIFTQIVEADHDDALRDLIKGCMSDKPTIAVNNTKPMSIATIISYYYERRYWTDRAWTENAEKGRLNWHHLPDAIGLALNKELRNELSVPNTTFIFSHYPALVEQAGQLHI